MADLEIVEGNENELPNEFEGRPQRRKKTKKSNLLKMSLDKKIVIEYDDYGIPTGNAAVELRSYVGVMVRDNISILIEDWRRVPLHQKERLWKYFQTKFLLDVRSKQWVFNAMGCSLRNFRSMLNVDFIQPNKDNMKNLALPPIEYPSILKNEWQEFVRRVLGDAFEEKSKKGKEIRAKIKYNHRLGSSGYRGLLDRKKNELSGSFKDIDRSELWLMARKKKDGDYEPEVKEVAKKIDDLKRQVDEGSFQRQGVNDILTKALDKPPNGSRVQGLGTSITPTMYFHTPSSDMHFQKMTAERKALDEKYELMMTRMELMDAQFKAYSRTDVGSCSVAHQKSPVSTEVCFRGQSKLNEAFIEVEATKKTSSTEKAENIVFPKLTPKRSPKLKRSFPIEHIQKTEEEDDPHLLKPKAQKPNSNKKLLLKRKSSSETVRMFSMLVEALLQEDKMINHDESLFGFKSKTWLCKSVCQGIIDFDRVSNGVIELWARHLHEQMKNAGSELVKFSSVIISPVKCSEEFINSKSRYVADLLKKAEESRFLLITYNPGNHWVLVAIDILAPIVYYLDSLGSEVDSQLQRIIDLGFKMFHVSKQNTKLNLKWTITQCPKQESDYECGYFVMKYMKDIVESRKILKHNFKEKTKYSYKDLDIVRDEWATYVANLITKY